MSEIKYRDWRNGLAEIYSCVISSTKPTSFDIDDQLVKQKDIEAALFSLSLHMKLASNLNTPLKTEQALKIGLKFSYSCAARLDILEDVTNKKVLLQQVELISLHCIHTLKARHNSK